MNGKKGEDVFCKFPFSPAVPSTIFHEGTQPFQGKSEKRGISQCPAFHSQKYLLNQSAFLEQIRHFRSPDSVEITCALLEKLVIYPKSKHISFHSEKLRCTFVLWKSIKQCITFSYDIACLFKEIHNIYTQCISRMSRTLKQIEFSETINHN